MSEKQELTALSQEEIEKIYDECKGKRKKPEWDWNEKNERTALRDFVSIDVWCE